MTSSTSGAVTVAAKAVASAAARELSMSLSNSVSVLPVSFMMRAPATSSRTASPALRQKVKPRAPVPPERAQERALAVPRHEQPREDERELVRGHEREDGDKNRDRVFRHDLAHGGEVCAAVYEVAYEATSCVKNMNAKLANHTPIALGMPQGGSSGLNSLERPSVGGVTSSKPLSGKGISGVPTHASVRDAAATVKRGGVIRTKFKVPSCKLKVERRVLNF
jgi:hypothetical protein